MIDYEFRVWSGNGLIWFLKDFFGCWVVLFFQQLPVSMWRLKLTVEFSSQPLYAISTFIYCLLIWCIDSVLFLKCQKATVVASLKQMPKIPNFEGVVFIIPQLYNVVGYVQNTNEICMWDVYLMNRVLLNVFFNIWYVCQMRRFNFILFFFNLVYWSPADSAWS